MLCMLDTIAAKRGGCALGRVCKHGSQTLAWRSDLHAVQAQPGFHEIMPRCLFVCVHVCVCVCVHACVCHEALSRCAPAGAYRRAAVPCRMQAGGGGKPFLPGGGGFHLRLDGLPVIQAADTEPLVFFPLKAQHCCHTRVGVHLSCVVWGSCAASQAMDDCRDDKQLGPTHSFHAGCS